MPVRHATLDADAAFSVKETCCILNAKIIHIAMIAQSAAVVKRYFQAVT